MKYRTRVDALAKLGNPNLINHPGWGSPRLTHDSMVYMAEHDASDRAEVLVLPDFDPESGKMIEIRPDTVVCAELPKDVQKRLGRNAILYAPANATPEEKLRRLSQAIKSAGYSSSLGPTIRYHQQPTVKEEETPETSQKKFEEWRRKSGGRRF